MVLGIEKHGGEWAFLLPWLISKCRQDCPEGVRGDYWSLVHKHFSTLVQNQYTGDFVSSIFPHVLTFPSLARILTLRGAASVASE